MNASIEVKRGRHLIKCAFFRCDDAPELPGVYQVFLDGKRIEITSDYPVARAAFLNLVMMFTKRGESAPAVLGFPHSHDECGSVEV